MKYSEVFFGVPDSVLSDETRVRLILFNFIFVGLKKNTVIVSVTYSSILSPTIKVCGYI